MHAGEHAVSATRARPLIAAQMPGLAHLPLRRVGQTGTDAVLFRVGPALVARFPRLPQASGQIALLARWLPTLQPALPLAVPVATWIGAADQTYPFAWSVGPWLPGRDAHAAPPDQMRAATDLAGFLTALHNQPRPPHAPQRHDAPGLHHRLTAAAPCLTGFAAKADPAHLRLLLAQAQMLPPWSGTPVWVRGDLHALNLVTRRGQLTAVINWGAMGPGDPAMDLFAAWMLFDPPARARFRALLAPDPATWARARARALAKAIMAIPYDRQSNPVFHQANLRTLTRILQDPDT